MHLLNLRVEYLYFVVGRINDLLEIAIDLPVFHLVVAQVADAVRHGIVLCNPFKRLTAHLAHRFPATLAMSDRVTIDNDKVACEGGLAEHAIVRWLTLNLRFVKCIRQSRL